jgi:DNA-directed RNA polymerase subunit beta'
MSNVLINIDKFCENLKEVTSLKPIDKKKFHPSGLFSEQIFGPLKNYTCQCGTYHGISKVGTVCSECGVEIVHSIERRRRFAKIVLPMRVVNPIFYELLSKLGGSLLKKNIDELMKNEKSFLYKDGEDYILETGSPPEGIEIWDRTEAIYELVSGLATQLANEGVKEWKIIKDNIDCLFINNILVLPPDLRPAAKGMDKNNQIMDKINRFYVQILTKKESMRNTTLNVQVDKGLYYTYFKQLQKGVNELNEYIISKMSKKEGLIRGNILGKRIDFSGRAVIVPEPLLKLDECVLPYLIILELFKIKIAKKLIDLKKFKLLNEAIDFIDKCIEMSDPVLFEACQTIVKNEVCILNRQPTLHRLGMIGFKIKTSLDKVIKLHPLVCSGFNADFDGDQMAVYLPISEKTKNEVREKFLSTKNLTNPSNGSLVTTPSQDIVLGIYMVTTIPSEKIDYKGETISIGEKIFNDCLPEDYPIVKGSVNNKLLKKILTEIRDNYSEEIIANTLDKIKETGFKYATIHGTSMSLKDVEMGEITEIKNKIYSLDNIQDQLMMISSKEIEEEMRKNFKYAYLIDSGARGKWDQVRQIILTRGYISNFQGTILPTPIKHNLIEGLTQEEFFNSTYGCRKGLLDVALNTGASGYISRKLIFTCVNLVLGDEEDCGTTDYLDVFVDNEQKARMLVGRYFLKNESLDEITNENYMEIVGAYIRLRSPILCKHEKICHKCYGNSYKYLHSKFVGIIAAQALGEKTTQLILRTFHTSGVAKVSEDQKDMKQSDIISDLSSVSKILHNSEKRKYPEQVSSLYSLFSVSGDILHVHFECVISQTMWKGSKKWRLLEKRDVVEPEYYSIQTVPEKESSIVGLAFSNPKDHIIKGIIREGYYEGIYDKIMLGEIPS